ncbi:hypothetical protein BOX17_01330 [Halomonas aestuarii]|uniref:DUF3450 domain-containing protein n=1 Tax=Halomonas aestuarii TaxID=1897729 RepID=A0A1J0VCG2_9GAMM|nr:DUF3450 domain-containing protein [Halomonas aestuarii]APE29718.1 hypothetical protein BOX17_01330 [Halomonas aestuarii]
MFRFHAVLVALVTLCGAGYAQAQESLVDRSAEAQRRQAELQTRIDAADDETRRLIGDLRQARAEAQRVEAYNAELERVVARQAEALARRERALEGAATLHEELPPLLRGMVERLDHWIEADLPFLRDERRARVASLERVLSDPALSPAERLDRVLAAWRGELAYGRELDAWRGLLDGEREVDFLRLGRVGFYYLTPNGHEGGVWKVEEQAWQPLDKAARRSLADGLRIAREQRAPELLTLPVSQTISRPETTRERGGDAS